jgi:peptidoglycan/xylan/chitin deacetylase (PgdA/CDA1 family)
LTSVMSADRMLHSMESKKKVRLILISLAVLCLPLQAAGKVVILDYHSFLGTGKSNLDYSEKELGAELDAIAAMGYKFVSLDDAIAGRIEGQANIVVTIDDGNHSVYRAVKEVFEPRGIKPFLFIYPAIVIGHSRYAITAEQLKALAGDGCGVGAHGFYHNPVTEKAWARNPKSFAIEINRPGPALTKLLGTAPTTFAYPYGVFSRKAEDDVAAAGYAWAFAADDKIRQVCFDDAELDRMAVPRTITYRYQRKALLKALKQFLDYDWPSRTPPLAAPSLLPPPTDDLPGEVAR